LGLEFQKRIASFKEFAMREFISSTTHPHFSNQHEANFMLNLSFRVSNDAVVIRDITAGQRGRIHYMSTDWFARSADDTCIPVGSIVHLLRRDGNTWLVQLEVAQPFQNVA
jgi:membrane protein implicated in regulation of membrane protease activity